MGKAWHRRCCLGSMQKTQISIIRDFVHHSVFIIMVKMKRPIFNLRINVMPSA